MSDAAEMDFIKHLLKDPYRTILSRQGPCRDAEEMVDRLLHLGHEQKTTKNILPSSSNGRRNFKGKNTTVTSAATKIVDSLPEKYRNLPVLTKELRAQLFQERRCLRCREQGHRQNDSTCLSRITWMDVDNGSKHSIHEATNRWLSQAPGGPWPQCQAPVRPLSSPHHVLTHGHLTGY